MARKTGINPLIIVLPVACLFIGGAAVYLSISGSKPKPADIPQVTPISELAAPAPNPARPALPPAVAGKPVAADPHAALSGMVVDGSLSGVSGILLSLFGPTGILDASTVSSSTGGYRFDRLLPGPCQVVVEATGYARAGLSGLNLIAGTMLPDATVLLLPEAPIRGQVRANLTGELLAGARVTADLFRVDRRLIPLVAPFHRSITAVADASGNYRLAGLWPHVHYDLVAEASGFVRGVKTQIDSGQDGVDFALSKGGAISGVVVQADGGEPAAGAVVTGKRLDLSSYSVNSDAEGRFFLSGLPRGEYALDGTWNNFFPIPDASLEKIAVEVGREVSGVTMELRKGGSIAGRVADRRTRQAIPNAMLELFSAWGKTTVPSDDRGRFQFPGLRDSAYQLSAAAPTYAATTAFVKITSGTDTQRDLFLSGGNVLAGFVKEPGGRPVPGAIVRYARQRPSDMRSIMGGGERYQGDAVADSTGYFRYQPVDNGVYDLMAAATDYAPGRAPGVETGNEAVEIVLSAGGSVAGSVTSVTGEPLPNVLVNASGMGSLNNSRDLLGGQTRTGADGNYRLDHLEPGNYIVSVDMPRRRVTDQEIQNFQRQRDEWRRQRGGNPGNNPGGGRGGRGGRGGQNPPGQNEPAPRQSSLEPQLGETVVVSAVRLDLAQGVLNLNPSTALSAVQVAQVAPPPQGGRPGGGRGPGGGPGGRGGRGGFGGPSGIAELRTRQVVSVKEGEVAVAHFGARDCVTLTGTVADKGKPVEGAWIGLSEGDSRDMAEVRRFGVAGTRTDSEGKFELLGLAPGAVYYVHAARSGGDLPVSMKVDMPDFGEKHVAIDLPSGGVKGVVRDQEGHPVAGANVVLQPAEDNGAADQPVRMGFGGMRRGGQGGIPTDKDGAFQINAVPDGEYFARATQERTTAVVPVEVRGNRVAEVNITLAAAGSMEGQISGMGIDGDSRVDAMFLFRDRDNGAVTPVFGFRGFAGGQYHLDNLTPGRYDVTCLLYSQNAAMAPEEGNGIVIRSGETTRCNFAMDPGVMVRLSIVDETGLPLRDAEVLIRDGYGNPVVHGVAEMGSTYNTWAGSFQRRNYMLWVQKPGYRETRLALDLSESDASITRRVVLVNDKVELGTGKTGGT